MTTAFASPFSFVLRMTAVLALTLAGAAQAASVTGSGNIQSEARAVSGFQAIALKTSVKVVLRQGSREGAEVRADDNVLPLIETQVVDSGGVPTLEIRSKSGTNYRTRTMPVVTVDLIKLSGIAISGSGDVSGDQLKGPNLKVAISGAGDVRLNKLAVDDVGIKVSGSGDIRLDGRAAKLAVAIAGSGDVDTIGLEADDVSVGISGSGDASVNARKTLSVSIAGTGSVAYTGDAVPKTSIAGMGTVRRK